MPKSRVVALVSGRVQGVGYRAYARQKALELSLTGYAENLPDGRVEVVAEGDLDDLGHFLAFLKRGPRLSKVENVEAMWSQATGLQGFSVL